MNFFCDSGGEIIHVDPERVYQGSANANTIYFIGAFPSNAEVLIAYELPDKTWTTPKRMTGVSSLAEVKDENGNTFSVWSTRIGAIMRLDENGNPVRDENDNIVYDLDYTITQHYGTVGIQFFVYANAGNGRGAQIATARSSFVVEKGVPIVLPDEPTDDYEVLLADILSVISDIRYVQESQETATEAAVRAEAAAERAEAAAEGVEGIAVEVENKVNKTGDIMTGPLEVRGDNGYTRVSHTDVAHYGNDGSFVLDSTGISSSEARGKVSFPQKPGTMALQEDLATVEEIAKGAQQAVSYADYQTMVAALNALPSDKYNVGQNVMIVTLNVPDLWVSYVTSTQVEYTYTSDEAFVNELATNGYVQVGFFRLSALETGKISLDYTKVTVGGVYQNIWDADTKVDKPTNISGYNRVIGVYANNNQAVYDVVYPNYNFDGDAPSRNGIPYYVNGNLGCAIPISDYHTANKKYVDDGFVAKKPDINAGWQRVYGMTSTGEEAIYRVHNGTEPSTIASRGVGGILKAGAPQASNDCVTLGAHNRKHTLEISTSTTSGIIVMRSIKADAYIYSDISTFLEDLAINGGYFAEDGYQRKMRIIGVDEATNAIMYYDTTTDTTKTEEIVDMQDTIS